MFEDIKKTSKQTLVYSVGNVLPKLVGFVLIPLYLSKLSTYAFGVLTILFSISQIMIGIFGFNIHTAMLRWLEVDKSKDYKKSIVFTAFISTILIAVTISLMTIPFSKEISIALFSTTDYSVYFIWLVISSGVGIINNIPLNLIRYFEKPYYYILISSIKFIIILGLNFYFLLYTNLGIEGIIIAELVGNIYLLLQSAHFIYSNMIAVFNYNAFLGMFKYGLPLIFSTLSTLALSLSDRFIIKYYLGDSNVGIYSLGNKIASFINVFIIQSFQLGFLPIALKKFSDPKSKRFFVKVFTYFTLLLVYTALFFALFSMEIVKYFSSNKSYWAAYTVIPALSLGFVLRGMQYIISLVFYYEKKTHYNAVIVLISALINILLNILLIPIIGILGAAWAFVISTFILIIMTYFYSQKFYFLNYEIGKTIKLFLTAFFIFFLASLVNGESISIRILTKTFLLILLPAILYTLNYYEEIEIKKIKEISLQALSFFKIIK